MDAEHNFVVDAEFDERLGLTCAQVDALPKSGQSTDAVEVPVNKESESSESVEPIQSTVRPAMPNSVTINAGNIVFPSNLSPISSSPVPANPAKKRKLEILEELAEGMKSMTANFSQLLQEVKEANRGGDDDFDIISDN